MRPRRNSAAGRLALRKAERELGEILAGCPELRLAGFAQAPEAPAAPREVWSLVARRDAGPVSRLPAPAPPARLRAWTTELLREMDVDRRFFLSVGGLGVLPWARIESENGRDALAGLLTRLPQPELVVVAADWRDYLGVTEEEDDYAAFRGRLKLSASDR